MQFKNIVLGFNELFFYRVLFSNFKGYKRYTVKL